MSQEPSGPSPGALLEVHERGALLGNIPSVGTRVEPREPQREMLTVEARPPPAKREKEFYLAFLALQKSDPEILERSAAEVLESAEEPDCKKVALLRALYDTRPETAIASFELAIVDLPDRSNLPIESVSSYALRFLCEHAGIDTGARSALERQLWSGAEQMSPGRRSQAAAALFAVLPADDLYRLTPRLSGERDPSVLAGAAAGLRANSADPAWASRVLEALPVSPPEEDPVSPTE